MIHFYTAYMDRRDVTKWISALEVRQPRGTIYRQFDLSFAGWDAIESYQTGATWDIFASYDESTPRAELAIRAGVVPPDLERMVTLNRAGVPTIKVRGYDHVWLAQRRRSTETIVAIPGNGFTWDIVEGQKVLRQSTVEDALRKHRGPVGRYKVWQHVRTVHGAVKRLANEAGLRVELRFPNRELVPFVVSPELSYWQAILDLVKPWAPDIFYRRSLNTVLFLDPEAPRYGIGRELLLAADNVVSVDSAPVRTKRIRRILLRFPSWL